MGPEVGTASAIHASNANFVDPNLGDLPPLYSHCIDELRPVKVICIGAGFSGILAGIRFPQRIQNLDFTIYEKNEEVGGTWFENKYGHSRSIVLYMKLIILSLRLSYPGVRCDVPSAAYQYTFESNSQWSEYYCSGAEINEYIKNTARKYGVYKYIKFRHEYRGATFDERSGKWKVTLTDTAKGKV